MYHFMYQNPLMIVVFIINQSIIVCLKISPTADLKISCMLSLLIGSLEHMLKATGFRIYLFLSSQWISSTPSQHYQITCLEQFEWLKLLTQLPPFYSVLQVLFLEITGDLGLILSVSDRMCNLRGHGKCDLSSSKTLETLRSTCFLSIDYMIPKNHIMISFSSNFK